MIAVNCGVMAQSGATIVPTRNPRTFAIHTARAYELRARRGRTSCDQRLHVATEIGAGVMPCAGDSQATPAPAPAQVAP